MEYFIRLTRTSSATKCEFLNCALSTEIVKKIFIYFYSFNKLKKHSGYLSVFFGISFPLLLSSIYKDRLLSWTAACNQAYSVFLGVKWGSSHAQIGLL